MRSERCALCSIVQHRAKCMKKLFPGYSQNIVDCKAQRCLSYIPICPIWLVSAPAAGVLLTFLSSVKIDSLMEFLRGHYRLPARNELGFYVVHKRELNRIFAAAKNYANV